MNNFWIQDELKYKGVSISRRDSDWTVNITDFWKAEGKPSPKRPDKWYKSPEIQDILEGLSSDVENVQRDRSGKIIFLSGVLEVVRGGSRKSQGTYVSVSLASKYTENLSNSCYSWFKSNTEESVSSKSTEPVEEKKFAFPSRIEDFGEDVRFTPDRKVSVYDAIAFSTGHKNPRQVWKDLVNIHPSFVQKTDKAPLKGRDGVVRKTPVATLQVFIEILVTLPGRLAAQVREEAVRCLVRVMEGDVTLVEEIISRVSNPQDLENLEEAVKRRILIAYGDRTPLGTLNNPLTEITSEVKNGYGWVNKEEKMESLIVELATYCRGLSVERQSPHRPYSDNTKGVKSRRIDLVLQSLESLDVLHIYQFKASYVDDSDVIKVFQNRAYPELAYRDFKDKGIRCVVAHLVSPGGITVGGVERLKEVQLILDSKHHGAIKLDSMLLGELVWGEIYPAIQKRYQDNEGGFGTLHLNSKPKKICNKLFNRKLLTFDHKPSKKIENSSTHRQLSLFE